MSIIRIERLLSNQNIMAQAMVNVGLIEDRKVLVEERVSKEALNSIARRNGEQVYVCRRESVDTRALFMAAVAAMNSLQVEDVVLFLEELLQEERTEKRAAFMQSVKEKRDKLVAKATGMYRRAQALLLGYVAQEDDDTRVNPGVIRILAKATMVAKARLIEASC